MPAESSRDVLLRKPEKICFILPGLPWPPRENGLNLRYFPIVQEMASRHEVELLILADRPAGLETAKLPIPGISISWAGSRPISAANSLRRLSTRLKLLSPFGPAYSFYLDNPPFYIQTVRDAISRSEANIFVWVGMNLGLCEAVYGAFSGRRLVIDFIDSPYLLFSRSRPKTLLEQIFRPFDSWKQRRWELKFRNRADQCIYIASPDASAVGEPQSGAPIAVIPNGVFVDDLVTATPSRHQAQNKIGFLGNMAYGPNVLAAEILLAEILPLIRATLPDATASIIGRDPVASITSRRCDFIEVTGTVGNIWPYIQKIGVFIFPMRSGAGLQNKILEAMAAGVPVVASPYCADSLERDGRDALLVASSSADFAAAATSLLTDQNMAFDLGARGREFVYRNYGWASIFPRYEEALIGAGDTDKP